MNNWIARFPYCNIAIVTTLRRIIAVRCNDETAICQADELFGDTPGRVRTPFGEDRYYRADGVDLGRRRSLRRYRRNIDLVHGSAGLVLAPRSVDGEGTGFPHEWISGGLPALRELPVLPTNGLQKLLEKKEPVAIEELIRRATCTINADDMDFFKGCGRNWSDALALLVYLQIAWRRRSKRGETFPIAIEAMVKARVMGDWSERRTRAARDVLLREGFIRELYPARREKYAAQYLLGPRELELGFAMAQTCTPRAIRSET